MLKSVLSFTNSDTATLGIRPAPYVTDASCTSSGQGSLANLFLPSLRPCSTRSNRQIPPPLQIASGGVRARNSGIPDAVRSKSEKDDILVTTKGKKRVSQPLAHK